MQAACLLWTGNGKTCYVMRTICSWYKFPEGTRSCHPVPSRSCHLLSVSMPSINLSCKTKKMHQRSTSTHCLRNSRLVCAVVGFLALIPVGAAYAHGVSSADQEAMIGGGAVEYVWLGATHMLTGYDHLLFLFGVIFFLTGFRDVVRFITAFTLGHCITLLGATLAGISANAHLIDAVIAVSVMYKGFENLGGFKRVFKRDAPSLLWVVFGFGLIHGFGLSARLQDLPLGDDGLIIRILSFNVGVELGQIAALCVMVMFFAVWRKSASFIRFSTLANQGLVLAGLGLLVFQLVGFFTELNHPGHHEQPVHEYRQPGGHHGHDHGGHHGHDH